MSQNEEEFVSPEEERENVLLLTYLTVRGYEIEHGEPLSVDNQVMQQLIAREVAAGNSIPEVTIGHENDRLSITVRMTGGEDE